MLSSVLRIISASVPCRTSFFSAIATPIGSLYIMAQLILDGNTAALKSRKIEVVGQDGILRAGWQPALYGPFCKLRQAG
jgi:hypothetical protein